MKHGLLWLAIACAGACVPFQEIPPTATFPPLSAPTLEPSPTVRILSSDELYDGQAGGQNEPTAASLPSGGALPPLVVAPQANGAQGVRIVLSDGVSVDADLYENALVRSAGVVLFARDKGVWGALPQALYDAGFTVLAVNMRPSAPRAEDVGAVLLSFSELASVDPAHLAVVGESEGADHAFLGCAVAPLCDAAALLSPTQRNTLLNVVANFRPRPLLLAVGQDDPVGYPIAIALVNFAPDTTRVLEYPFGTGAGLLTLNAGLTDALIAWLNSALNRTP